MSSVNKKEVEQALKDYNWMLNEIKRQRQEIEYYDGGNLVAQGGIDSVMPKAQGGTGDPVAMEVVRRENKSDWILKLERKVLFIQKRIPVIQDEREKAVLECMLDGMSMSAIGHHMGLSRRHIYTLKESITSQFAHFSQELPIDMDVDYNGYR